MATIKVWCYDDGTNSTCWDSIATTVANAPAPTAVLPKNVAYRIAKWDSAARTLYYNKAHDCARLYQQLIAAVGVTLVDTATVTVSGTPTTALSVVRSDAAWLAA